MDIISLICLTIGILPFLIFLALKKPYWFPFGLYLFLLPFDSVLSLPGGEATLTKFLGVATMAALIATGLLRHRMTRPDFAALWWVLLIAYGIISMTWAIDAKRVVSGIPSALGLLVLYLVVASYRFSKDEFELLKKIILAGGVVAGIYSIYLFFTGSSYIRTGRASIMLAERTTNPNMFAFSLLIPASICIERILNQKKLIYKILFGSIIMIMLFGIGISGSRGGFLGLGVIVIVFILHGKQKVTFSMIAATLAILLFALLPEIFVSRLQEAIESQGSGRLGIWYVGWHALQKYWLIGAGASNFTEVYNEFAGYAPYFMGYGRGPHNIYLGLLIELGVIGFAILIAGIVKHYRAIVKVGVSLDNNNDIMLKAAVWGVLISCFFSTFIWTKDFWLVWMLIMMHKNISDPSEESEYAFMDLPNPQKSGQLIKNQT